MKRIFSALLVICMIFSVMASASVQVFAADTSTPKNIFYAKYIGEADDDFEGEAPVIDGKINPDEWLESDFQEWPKAAQHNMSFVYDEENLYIAVRIQNEKAEVPYFPLLWWNSMDRFIFWLDPYDEAINSDDGVSASYFMEFHTQYAQINSDGTYRTELYTDDPKRIGPEITPRLNYYDIECKANTDDLFSNLPNEITPETLNEHITFEDGKPWGLEVPNGVWEFEYKIPFGIMNILDVENDITVTNTDGWGTKFPDIIIQWNIHKSYY